MIAKFEKAKSKFTNFFNRFIPLRKKRQPVRKIHTKRRKALSPENQIELERLCTQLFKKKDMITSGRLQFIGLAKVQKRLGKRWESLSKIVFDTVDTVIHEYTGKGDVFIRYRDDTYILIFAHASLEEGNIKAALIAEEIQRRLFELKEEELRDIEIRKAISQIKTNFFEDSDFSDFLDSFATDDDLYYEEDILESREEEIELVNIPAVDVEAKNCRPSAKKPIPNITLENIHFSYLPLWDVSRNALTTYLCLAKNAQEQENNALEAHKNFYEKLSEEQRVTLDIKILKHVIAELDSMEKEERKFLIACPVNYETLYSFSNYEHYKKHLEQIPPPQKQFLVFLIMNMAGTRPPKNPYWFAAPLKEFCRHVFAEVPLRRDINFHYLLNTGVDVVGVRLNKTRSEQEIINILNGFSAKAKSVKINKTFALGLSSLSLATSTVCAGFDFIGGIAIHNAITKPDTIHKYLQKDLVADFLPKQSKRPHTNGAEPLSG